jgi:hypothetical protein
VNDNNGNLFTVQTLAPIVPPWSENFDHGATNWSTYEADGSQSQWTLGVPANGVQTAAHSPTNCWGSNLNGDSLDYTETFLISPAIQLTGGNSAKLTFWHNYDFTEQSPDDVFEAGTLYIVTGSGSQSTALAQYVDANFDWEQETIDLSPYAGQVVYFVWAYQLFSLDSAPRAGWLVDDVAITVTNVAGGTINITNNIWQADFVLSGPAYQHAKGQFLRLTNTPPGQYILEFADLLYYNTPPSQTNTLSSGGTLNFTGNYTFTDANTNGIPDGWEAQQFGGVSPQRTQTTDTDQDGMSDWAEFVAGTDPNNAPSLSPIAGLFRVTVSLLINNQVRLEWPSAPGHGYRVHGSTNGLSWSPFTDWIRASGYTTGLTLSQNTNGAPNLFRVEAQP